VLTSSATLITAKGYTMSGSAQTAGGTQTTPATSASNVKTAMMNPQNPSANYMVSFFGTTMKATLLSMAATTPAFSAPVALSPLTTVTSATLIPIGGEAGASGALAVIAGTDASGRFVIDFTFLDVNGALQGTTIRRAFAAAPTVAFFGQNSETGLMSVAAYSTKEAVLFTIDSAALSIAAESRTGALSAAATAPGAASTTDIRTAVARNTIASLGSGQAAALGDGSKTSFVNRGQSVLSTANGGMLPIADMTLAAKGVDSSEAWIAFNQAPDTVVTIQKVRVA